MTDIAATTTTNDISDAPMPSRNTQALIEMLRQRDAAGLSKYGTSMDRGDLTPTQWGQHLLEEQIDGAQYSLRVFQALELLETAVTIIADLDTALSPSTLRRGRHWLKAYRGLFGPLRSCHQCAHAIRKQEGPTAYQAGCGGGRDDLFPGDADSCDVYTEKAP